MAEATSSVVFGVYMAVAIALGVNNARNRKIDAHRRWMLRAFALALGVSTIRVILGLGEAFDVFTFDEAFGIAFWAGLTINAVVIEAWLRLQPGRKQGGDVSAASLSSISGPAPAG
jgi:hypothetical protein